MPSPGMELSFVPAPASAGQMCTLREGGQQGSDGRTVRGLLACGQRPAQDRHCRKRLRAPRRMSPASISSSLRPGCPHGRLLLEAGAWVGAGHCYPPCPVRCYPVPGMVSSWGWSQASAVRDRSAWLVWTDSPCLCPRARIALHQRDTSKGVWGDVSQFVMLGQQQKALSGNMCGGAFWRKGVWLCFYDCG